MAAQDIADRAPIARDRGRQRRMVMWLAIGLVTALVTYFGFRAYLSPDLLFHFGNALHC
jgi:hypothetical protein